MTFKVRLQEKWANAHPGDALLVLQHLAGGLGLCPVLGCLLHRLQPFQLLINSLFPTQYKPKWMKALGQHPSGNTGLSLLIETGDSACGCFSSGHKSTIKLR